MALVKKGDQEVDYTIKPEAVTPAIDSSSWPLLLKNYNNCTHYKFFYDLQFLKD
jgi:H/ACA ribonucleoprotein complex subunit 4